MLLFTAEVFITPLGLLVFIGIIAKLLLIGAAFELHIERIDKLLTPAMANVFNG